MTTIENGKQYAQKKKKTLKKKNRKQMIWNKSQCLKYHSKKLVVGNVIYVQKTNMKIIYKMETRENEVKMGQKETIIDIG